MATDGYLTRAGSGLCVRPHRYALAVVSGVVAAGALGLHECDNPVCVKVADATEPHQHVVSGCQGDNMERLARMRRGDGLMHCDAWIVVGCSVNVGGSARPCATVGLPPRCKPHCWVISPRCGEPATRHRTVGDRDAVGRAGAWRRIAR